MKALLTSIWLVTTIFFKVVLGSGDNFAPNPVRSGPWVEATEGGVWPKPLQQVEGETLFTLDPNIFRFEMNDFAARCDILVDSLPRFYARAFPLNGNKQLKREISLIKKSNTTATKDPLLGLTLNLASDEGCETLPHLHMNESYSLNFELTPVGDRSISAVSVWGLLRGLETFSQLVYFSLDSGAVEYEIRSTSILDSPRFPHRGFMLDSSRHFLSVGSLLQTLDLMEMNKMNVFHWHLSDDTSFPYQSAVFPELSNDGAFDPVTHVYTASDVNTIIREATLRGIRVIPEFDTPGHTQSWSNELLTPCYPNGVPDGFFGPMDPTKESVYQFLETFFWEIKTTFPDSYIHVGGDEVNPACWLNNPSVSSIMQQWNISGNWKALESYFIGRVLDIVESSPLKKTGIVWEDVFDNGDEIAPDTLIHVWQNWQPGWRVELQQITAAGKWAILSAPWYLNYIDYGSDWVEMYEQDPHDFFASPEAKQFVLGGEACIWGEFVNSANLIPRSWPRASAVAERLWSGSITKAAAAAPRMQEHECRMVARGYQVQPGVGGGYCPVEWE